MDQPGRDERLGERRRSNRFRIQVPAVVTIGNREIWAFTREISARAVYFKTAGEEERPPIGEVLEFVIKIPPSLSLSKPSFIKGRGRTLRVDDPGGAELGVVVEILEYDIESEFAHKHLDERTNPEG